MKYHLILPLWLLVSFCCSAQNLQKGSYGYLYCHMSDKGEWTAYAVSRDGLHYQDILGGDSIFSPTLHARIEGGTRDAYICRKHNGKGYLMVTTDMCVRRSHRWDNYGIDLLQSKDLITWSSVTFDFRQGRHLLRPFQPRCLQELCGCVPRLGSPNILGRQLSVARRQEGWLFHLLLHAQP